MIDFGSCFSYGIEKLKQNPAFYLVGALIVAGVLLALNLIAQGFGFIVGFAAGLLAGVMHLNSTATTIVAAIIGGIIGLLIGLLIAPVLVGFFKGIRKEYEGGTAEIGDLFSAFSMTGPCLLNYAVATLAIVIGLLCCIIPGFLVAPLTFMTVFFLAKGQTQGLEAFKSAWELLKKNPIIILWSLILHLFVAAGVLLCGVGVLVTFPIAASAMYKMFQQALGEDNPSPVLPTA